MFSTFASENLLHHEIILTLELKSNQMRWYPKEAILTDRALYLHKVQSDYEQAHQRQDLSKIRARLASEDNTETYADELPELHAGYEVYVELHVQDTDRNRLIALANLEKAQKFVKMFNLVGNFTLFEQALADQLKLNDPRIPLIANAKDAVRIHNWVQEFPKSYLGHNGEFFTFSQESVNDIQSVIMTLAQMFKESVTALSFQDNQLTDQSFKKQLLPGLRSFSNLRYLKIVNNRLGPNSLEVLASLLDSCPELEELDFSNNQLGYSQSLEQNKITMDMFLKKLLSDVNNATKLNLSYNQIGDECLYPIIQYSLAPNMDSQLSYFNIEGNRFTAFGLRTLLKAFTLSPNREILEFKIGPMSMTIENLRAGFVFKDDKENLDMFNHLEGPKVHLRDRKNDIIDQVYSCTTQLTIQRKGNDFEALSNYPKRLANSKADQEKMDQILKRIEAIVENERDTLEIEKLREFIRMVTHEIEFEIPRHKLEILFKLINEKLDIAARDHGNIYQLEVLLDCLRFMNARNIPAENKYHELAVESQYISYNLQRIINMSHTNDAEMLKLLEANLQRGKKIGLRGELIDTARYLYFIALRTLGEMRDHDSDIEDDNDEAIYDVTEEDRPFNVYDSRLDQHIDKDANSLHLTPDVELNLATHPFRADYLRISNLNVNYLRKNLQEAKKFLKDEESYGYRNILERASVLLSDAGYFSKEDLYYNLARNDQNIKLARLIFRYKNNLDQLFPLTEERPQPNEKFLVHMKNTDFSSAAELTHEEDIKNFKFLTDRHFMDRPFTDTITQPFNRALSSEDLPKALSFYEALASIIKIDPKNGGSVKLAVKIQDLFETHIIQPTKQQKPKFPPLRRDSSIDHDDDTQPQIELTQSRFMPSPDLINEFYLQLYKFINVAILDKMPEYSFKNGLVVAALFSQYAVPTSLTLHQAIYQFFFYMTDSESKSTIIPTILNNFKWYLDQEDQKSMDNEEEVASDMTSEESFLNIDEEYVYWPPSFLQIQSMIEDQPRVMIAVNLTNGEQVQVPISVTTTVLQLLHKVVLMSPYLKHEQETESLWLYGHYMEHEDPNIAASFMEFDYPLPSDKKILKLMYQADKFAKEHLHKEKSHQDQRPLQQRMVLKVRKRMFPSIFQIKNFYKMHRHTLDIVFDQIRSDYIDKQIVKEVCNTKDIGEIGALLMRVKLNQVLLTNKKGRIESRVIEQNLHHAVPDCFISEEEEHLVADNVRNRQFWVSNIQEKFRKKEFQELSLEEAMERFLSEMTQYRICYSSTYVLQKDNVFLRNRNTNNQNLAKLGITGKLAQAFQTQVLNTKTQNDDSDSSDQSLADISDEEEKGRLAEQRKNKKNLTQIAEKQEEDNETSQNQEETSEDIESAHGSKKSKKVKQTRFEVASEFWGRIDGPAVIMVINLNGVSFIDQADRKNIFHHVDFEDMLYVMGKGQLLKIGFRIHKNVDKTVVDKEFDDESYDEEEGSEFMEVQTDDLRTQLRCNFLPGFKARVIAEDIVSYAQLRLLEFSKNDYIKEEEHHHHHEHINLKTQTTSEGNLAETQEKKEKDEEDFKGPQALLESQDLIDGGNISFIQAFHANDNHDQLGQEKEIQTPIDIYKKEIEQQVGQNLCFKDKVDNFFMYRRMNPTKKPYQSFKHEKQKIKLKEQVQEYRKKVLTRPRSTKQHSVEDLDEMGKSPSMNQVTSQHVAKNGGNSPPEIQDSKMHTKMPSNTTIYNKQASFKSNKDKDEAPAKVDLNKFAALTNQAAASQKQSQTSLLPTSERSRPSSTANKAVDFNKLETAEERTNALDKRMDDAFAQMPDF